MRVHEENMKVQKELPYIFFGPHQPNKPT